MINQKLLSLLILSGFGVGNYAVATTTCSYSDISNTSIVCLNNGSSPNLDITVPSNSDLFINTDYYICTVTNNDQYGAKIDDSSNVLSDGYSGSFPFWSDISIQTNLFYVAKKYQTLPAVFKSNSILVSYDYFIPSSSKAIGNGGEVKSAFCYPTNSGIPGKKN